MENNILDIKAGEGINLGVNGKEITISGLDIEEDDIGNSLKLVEKELVFSEPNSVSYFFDFGYTYIENKLKDFDADFKIKETSTKFWSPKNSSKVTSALTSTSHDLNLYCNSTSYYNISTVGVYKVPIKKEHQYLIRFNGVRYVGCFKTLTCEIKMQYKQIFNFASTETKPPILNTIATFSEDSETTIIEINVVFGVSSGCSGFQNMYIDGIMIVDLTEAYGEGNEPDLKTCESLPFIENILKVKK